MRTGPVMHKLGRLLSIQLVRMSVYSGFQVFSQLADFSHSGADFYGIWDQCKTIEKKNCGGGGSGMARNFVGKQFLAASGGHLEP